jgi:hypothetical protein
MKAGDLVRNKSSESGMLGLFLEWQTYDKKYTCPVVWWQDGRIWPIQASLLETVSESR